MSTERCGLGSLLPVSCRGRAEAFARRLQSRLRTLGRGEPGSEEEPLSGEEQLMGGGWGRQHHAEGAAAVGPHHKQPLVSPDTAPDRFFDFDMQDESAPGSPLSEELPILNQRDCLPSRRGHRPCSCPRLSSLHNGEEAGASSSSENHCQCSCSESGCCVASPQEMPGSESSDEEEEGLQYFEPAWDVLLSPDSAHQRSCHRHPCATPPGSPRSGNTPPSPAQPFLTPEGEVKEIRECVAKLCSEIISKAEAEVAIINSNESSPKVVISRVESTEDPEEQEENSKPSDPEEDEEVDPRMPETSVVQTLFQQLAVTQQEGTSDSSQVSTPDEDKPRRVQRSSSLKSGKTPPSTPGRKKIVRFADVLGLDLADVRTFLDEVPKVPSSAFWDLDVDTRQPDTPQVGPSKCLVPMFQQPVSSPDFLDKVRGNKVCLENAYQGDSLSISGTVRVFNLDFHKSVYVRYSLDSWENFADLQCQYVNGSSDGFSDKFSFVMYAHTLDVGQRVEFAIRYSSAGQQFWDSNGGVNYAFQCLNSTISTVQSSAVAIAAGGMRHSDFALENSPPGQDLGGWASFY